MCFGERVHDLFGSFCFLFVIEVELEEICHRNSLKMLRLGELVCKT